MAARVRPYIFYDVAMTICSACFRKLEGKIVFQDGKVFLLKRCPDHGAERVLVADDIDYYRRCREVFIKAPEMPAVYNTPVKWGCPYDCGLCTDHEQHSCLTLLEITDSCNLRCPVCYAASGPERLTHRSLTLIEKMLDAIVRNEEKPDVVQISGGEPTLHPQFFEIVALAKARPIRHLMVNTNGTRLAQDEEFVKRLSEIEDFEVYLQFDSFERDALMTLRGADLAKGTRAGIGTVEQIRYFHHPGGDAEKRTERRRNRKSNRFCAHATLRARRYVAANSGCRSAGTFRSGQRPPDAYGSAA